MRKPVKILAFILVFLLSVLLALTFCASYIFDSKFNDALRLVNSRQSYARIVYTPVSSSLLSKKGKVSVTVPESPVGELRATFAVDINFSVSSFTVRFHKENYDGNIDELLSSIGLPVIDMTGEVNFYPWQLKGDANLRTSAFDLNLEDGRCRIGDSVVAVSGRSLSSIDTVLKFSGINCRGRDIYSGREAYTFVFQNLKTIAKPKFYLSSKKISFDSFSVSFDELSADASTLYLIGFKPDDNVKDKTLRDSLSVKNFKVDVSFDNEDKNFQKVSSKGSMDAYFAFPRIREGQTVAFYDLSRLSYEISLDSINLMNLLKTIKHADDPMQSLILNLSKPVKVNLDNFSFIHNGKETKFQGQSSVSFNSVTKKPENVYLKLFAKSPVDFVDEWVDSQYKVGLEDYLKTGAISSDGSNYSTVLELNANKITLNGVDINSDIKSDESDEKSVKKDLTIDLDSL